MTDGRRAADHRPGLHHLRNLRTGQGRGAPPRLSRPAGLSPAAGPGPDYWGRNRRGADVSAARGPGQHRSRRRPLPARNGGPGTLRRCRWTAHSARRPGFYAHAILAVCCEMPVRFSITIRRHARLRNISEAIPETNWTPIPSYLDFGDGADHRRPSTDANCQNLPGQSLLHVHCPPFRHRHHPVLWIRVNTVTYSVGRLPCRVCHSAIIPTDVQGMAVTTSRPPAGLTSAGGSFRADGRLPFKVCHSISAGIAEEKGDRFT